MSNNTTAQSAYDVAAEKLQKAKDALELQHTAAREAIAKQRRLEAEVMEGNASVARELGEARLEAETATNSIDAFKQAVAKHERLEQQARLDMIVEGIKANAGELASDPQLEQLEAEAREGIDAILFGLADTVAAHNQAYADARRDIAEAQKGLAPNLGASVSRDMLMVEGTIFREKSPSSVLDNAVGHPAIRWNEDRNSGAIAKAKAEVEAKRADEAERMAADRAMRLASDAKDGKRIRRNVNAV